jgi:hypothetical protein
MFNHHCCLVDLICKLVNLLSVQATIQIADIDDTKPEFLNYDSWKFVVDESDATDSSGFRPVNLTQRVSVIDEDLPQNFYFTLVGEGIADGLIKIIQDVENSSEAILQVVQEIDRENPDIEALDGLLSYTLTVTDEGGNENKKEVLRTHIYLW